MMKPARSAAVIISAFLLAFPAQPSFSEDEIQYKKFKIDNVSCDAGISYSRTPNGMVIGVSAIATGAGADFRKWNITDIKLHMDGDRIKPDNSERFYVTKESFFRVPAAVIFFLIGTQYDGDSGKGGFSNAIGRTGVALGMGILALQAGGEIAGQRAIFNLDRQTADSIKAGRDLVEIVIENQERHQREIIRIGLIKLPQEPEAKPDYSGMEQGELRKMVDDLEVKVIELESEQKSYKYGVNPEYDEIQSKIEGLQTQRGLAYRVWFDRQHSR